MSFRRITTLDETRLELRLAFDGRRDRLRLPGERGRFAELFKDLETCALFIGYPRSGHSLVGSLLDAHPEGLVAHRLDILRHLHRGLDALDVFYLILRNSQRFAHTGRRLTGYSYAVPGGWQGRYGCLRLVGDQEGEKTVRRIAAQPGLLDRLQSRGHWRLRFVHVVRNPFDNITTMALRRYMSLRPAIERYFALCAAVASVRRQVGPERVIDLRIEDFVNAPVDEHRRLLAFLGLSIDPQHLANCARIVYASPHRSRTRRRWPPHLIAEVRRRASAHDFLAGYAYGDEARA